MKANFTTLFFATVTGASLLISGCDFDSNSSSNGGISSSGLSSLSDSTLSSSLSSSPENFSSSEGISNLGNPMNSFGYYGENVIFGDQNITGYWFFYASDENGKGTLIYIMRFFENGDTFIHLADFETCENSVYGVSEDGTVMSTNFSVYYNTYKFVGNEDGCLVFKWYNDDNATSEQNADLFYLCKQDEIGVPYCWD